MKPAFRPNFLFRCKFGAFGPLAESRARVPGDRWGRSQPAAIGPLLALVAVMASGCGLPEPSGDHRNRLVVSSVTPPRTFNPVVARETSSTAITDQLFIGLTRSDGVTGEVLPHLATDWKSLDGGRAWEFTLRDNLRWSDGEPLSADDVKFTYDRLYLNPDIAASGRDILTVEGETPEVTVLSDTRVRFEFSQPYAPFPRAAALGILPRHVLEDRVDAGTFESEWGVGTDPSSIVVNGPFTLEEYRPGQRVVLQRNPHYFERDEDGAPLPYLERVQFEIVQNLDVQIQKFRLGELDLIAVPAQYYPLLSPERERFDFRLKRVGPATGITFLALNQNTGVNPETGEPFLDPIKAAWFNDVDFRRAVSYAIDREEIIRIVMNGLGIPMWGPLSPSQGPFHHPEVRRYHYDPDRAREILDEAGYVDRIGDGIRQDSDGNPIRFIIVTNAGSDTRVRMAQMVRRDLSDIGLDVGFNQIDFNALVNQLSFTFDWEVVVMGLTGGPDPHFGSNVWVSSGGLHMWHPFQDEPERPWEAEIDQIFVDAVREVDEDRRRELYFHWQELVAEQLPLIFLPNEEMIFAVRNRLENVEPAPLGGSLHNLERIAVRSE